MKTLKLDSLTNITSLVTGFVMNAFLLYVMVQLVEEWKLVVAIIGFNFVLLSGTVIMSIRDNKRRNADFAKLSEADAAMLDIRLEKLEEAHSKILGLENKLAQKERALTEETERTESSRKSVEYLNKSCSDYTDQIKNKNQALEQMVNKLGYFAEMVHELPTPAELSGSDLKGMRFEALRIAIIGFAGLESFPWRHHESFKPAMYRDFVHNSLGEGALDPKQPWTADMILSAHKNPADKSAA